MTSRLLKMAPLSEFPLRPTIKCLLSAPIDSRIKVHGWIKSVRKQKAVWFAELWDGSVNSSLQAVIPPSLFKSLHSISPGSYIEAEGLLVESGGTGQPVELQTESIVIRGPCSSDQYPIQKNENSLDYLRNHATTFKMRTKVHAALSHLKSKMSKILCNNLDKNGFTQIFPPIITEHDCEGGGEAFRVEAASRKDFFSKPAYLTVSTQLHLEMAASALPRVFAFSPVFRAENQQTTRHLSEFWMLECEMSFIERLDELLNFIEAFLKESLSDLVAEEGIQQWAVLDDAKTENLIKKPFDKISYTDAIKELRNHSQKFVFPVEWGCDLKTEHERYLADVVFNNAVFVTDYPADLKPFYMKANSADGRTVACCDLLLPGIGEVMGGSLREDGVDQLEKSLHSKVGYSGPDHPLSWYLDLRRYGSSPHGGFGLGFDRLLQYISNTLNIRDMGISDKLFRETHPEILAADVASVINSLSVSGLLEMAKSTSGTLIYRAVKREETNLISLLDADERIVFMCIKGADNRGIWTKDLKARTNLHQTVLNKVLKSLELNKKLIKSVRNVKNPTRKVYMLVGLIPSVEITGGPWFSESELDVEFISELCRVCHRFILSRSFSPDSDKLPPASYSGYPALSEIHDFVMSSGVTSTPLGQDDVAMLLNRLVYDGEVERVMGVHDAAISFDGGDDDCDDLYVYRAIRTSSIESSLASIPCGNCPVSQMCSDRPPISPANCEYFKRWLSAF